MTTATEDATVIVRDLGEHGTLTYKETARSRGYWLETPDGEKTRRCVSVTTVLGILSKPAIIRWSEDWGARGALAAVRMGELDPSVHHDDEAIGIVRALGLGADAAKKKAADRGLTVHDALEAWTVAGDLPNPADMDPEHRPYLRGLASALLALDPEPTAVEQVTCDPAAGVAGRFDLRAIVNGRDTMCDLKTAKGGRGFPEAHVQLRAYDACEQALGADPAEHHIVLAVGPDGSFCADDCLADEHAWPSVLACYRTMQAVQKPLDALRRADAKARKEATT